MHRFHVTVRLIDETTYEMAYRYSQGGDDVKKSCMDKNEFAKRLQEQKTKYYRIAYSYVKNEHDALDIIGEATYKGLKELHTLKQPEYFDTWMTRIVINAAIDYIRKNTRLVYCEEDTIDVMKVTEGDL